MLGTIKRVIIMALYGQMMAQKGHDNLDRNKYGGKYY